MDVIKQGDFTACELRSVLGKFVTGVTVVTTVGADGEKIGVTVNSFSSVSLDPPLVLWSLDKKSRSHAFFERADSFVINILSSGQMETSQKFARQSVDKFAGTAHELSPRGNPILSGCTAYLECKSVQRYPGGDHTIFIGEVEEAAHTAVPPLAFGCGKYMQAAPIPADMPALPA